MPQKIIPILENETYHIFNRGVDKRDIFLDKSDYLRFYQSLHLFNSEQSVVNFDSALILSKTNNEKSLQNCLVEIQAYALLSNHFHLILKSVIDGGASEFMRRVSLGYASYFNNKYERNGALFQGPFKRVHIESQTQYQYLFAYVNENHFVHNLSLVREIFHTSSLHFQGKFRSKLIKQLLPNPYDYSSSVKLAQDIFFKRKEAKLEKELFD